MQKFVYEKKTKKIVGGTLDNCMLVMASVVYSLKCVMFVCVLRYLCLFLKNIKEMVKMIKRNEKICIGILEGFVIFGNKSKWIEGNEVLEMISKMCKKEIIIFNGVEAELSQIEIVVYENGEFIDNVELPLPVENSVKEYFEKIINDKKYAYLHKVLSQIEKIKE